MTIPQPPHGVRAAVPGDLSAIMAIARATGQDEDWDVVFPAYIGHLMARGVLLVAERGGAVTGYGGTLAIGAGERAVSMLTDLFVHPGAHGTGTGRALLAALWDGQPRRMTFSSLHGHALPLYTSFGVDAWWPLLYLRGPVGTLRPPPGWTVEEAVPGEVAALEREWTGADRAADHAFWAAWPAGTGLIASVAGRPAAAGTAGGAGPEYGICHLAVNPSAGREGAAGAVEAALSWLRPADGTARVCLPAPHPSVRPLLAAGWRVEEFDLFMASEPGLIDPRCLVPSPALA